MKVNWDDDIPNIWENAKNVPNHQPDDSTIFTCLKLIYGNFMQFWLWGNYSILRQVHTTDVVHWRVKTD